jgi:hypothetical protein
MQSSPRIFTIFSDRRVVTMVTIAEGLRSLLGQLRYICRAVSTEIKVWSCFLNSTYKREALYKKAPRRLISIAEQFHGKPSLMLHSPKTSAIFFRA